MRKTRLLALLLLSAPVLSAQTTVNLNVTDLGSQAWANGTWAVHLKQKAGTTGGPPFNINTGGGSVADQKGTLDASGNAAISLPANANIVPAQSVWAFTLCPNASSPCVTQEVTIVTTSPQTLNVTPPAIVVDVLLVPPPVQAYADAEIKGAVQGTIYYNTLTLVYRQCNAASAGVCSNWSTMSGGATWTSITGFPPPCALGTFVVNIQTGACAPTFPPTLTNLFAFSCATVANPVPSPPWFNITGITPAPFQSGIPGTGGLGPECQRNSNPAGYQYLNWALPNDQFTQAELDHWDLTGCTSPSNPLARDCNFFVGTRSDTSGTAYYFGATSDDGGTTATMFMYFGPIGSSIVTVKTGYVPNPADVFGVAVVGSTVFALLNGGVVAAIADPSLTSGDAVVFAADYRPSAALGSIQFSNVTSGSATLGTTSIPFSGITTASNTTATMTVASGASIVPTGTGVIQATTMPFGGITTGTNTVATMTVGTGASVTPSGSGTVTATHGAGLTPGNCVQAGAGGLLTTTAGACGSSGGTLTATGSPASPMGTFWSAPTSLTGSSNWTYAATSGHTVIQGANNANAFILRRNTDTVPTGNLLWAQSAGAGTLGTIDVVGTVRFPLFYGNSFTSTSAAPAVGGVIRLAKTDQIMWRNNANNNDNPLQVNGSDCLTYLNNTLPTFSGVLTAGHVVTITSNCQIQDGGTIPNTSYVNWGTTSTVCTTGTSNGATCTTAVPFNHSEADTAYKISCSGVGTMTGYPFIMGITTKGTTSATVTISNGASAQAVASTWTEIDCVIVR